MMYLSGEVEPSATSAPLRLDTLRSQSRPPPDRVRSRLITEKTKALIPRAYCPHECNREKSPLSIEAVTWAMEHAPMLLTPKGKKDTSARNVLQVLAEFAHADGSNAFPSVARIQYRTGFDERTVQNALRRLEAGRLIKVDGVRNGCTRYRLEMHLRRPSSDWEEILAEKEAKRAAATERKRRSRGVVTSADDVTVTSSNDATDDVTSFNDDRHALERRDVTSLNDGCHVVNAPRTVKEPPVEPPGKKEGAGPGNHSWGEAPASGWPDGPPAPIDTDGFQLNDAMRRWAKRDGFSELVDIDHATAQFVSHYRSTGARRSSWPDAWQKWIRDDAKKAAERGQRSNQPGNVIQLSSGQPLTGTDVTVAGWGAVADSFDFDEDTA